MPNNKAPSKASWDSDTAVANAITSRLNSDSSMPARPCVTPSHMAGTPPATCAVAPARRAAARITSGNGSYGRCAESMSLYEVTMPMLGMTDCCSLVLSSPDAAMTCARLAQASLPRAGSTSLRLRVRSRYSPRAAAERPPMRSVTSAMTSLIFLRRHGYSYQLWPCLSVKAIAAVGPQVPAGYGFTSWRVERQLDWMPSIQLHAASTSSRRTNSVRIALERVEQQSLVGDARAAAALGLRQCQFQRHFPQAHALEAGLLAEDLQRDAFLRLQVDHQAVGRQVGLVGREDIVRHGLELDGDVGAPRLQALAGAQVERHARPAPVVDFGAHRDEGLRVAASLGARLLVVAGHGDAARAAGRVLTAHRVGRRRRGADRPQAAQHLGLLVAHFVGFQQVRRLHRHQRHQLQHVVLHHVAQRAGVVVVAPAPFDAHGLRDGDLHVIDGSRLPQRLEQRVREAQRQQVLHRLLAEVVIDAKYLVFAERPAHGFVDLDARGEILADGLLEDHATVQAGEARGRQTLAGGAVQLRRRGHEIQHAVVAGERLLQRLGALDGAVAGFEGRVVARGLTTHPAPACSRYSAGTNLRSAPSTNLRKSASL